MIVVTPDNCIMIPPFIGREPSRLNRKNQSASCPQNRLPPPYEHGGYFFLNLHRSHRTQRRTAGRWRQHSCEFIRAMSRTSSVPDYELVRREQMRQNMAELQARSLPQPDHLLTLSRSLEDECNKGNPNHKRKSASKEKGRASDGSEIDYEPDDEDEAIENDDDDETNDARSKSKASQMPPPSIRPKKRSKRSSNPASTSSRTTRSKSSQSSAVPSNSSHAVRDHPQESSPSPAHNSSPPGHLTSRDNNSPPDHGNSPMDVSQGNTETARPDAMVSIQGQAGSSGRKRKRGRRRPTMGNGLQDHVKRNCGRKMHIDFRDGKPRPQDPIQAAKLSSEVGIHIRTSMPVATHWKEYNKEDDLKTALPSAINAVASKFDMDKEDEVAQNVCTEIFKKNLRQQRYRLKRDYFIGVPPDQVLANKPPNMTMENWVKLTTKWSQQDYQDLCEKNKKNREGVKHHQSTGSRSYCAHFTTVKEKYNNQEPTPIQFYKETHTRTKNGYMSADALQVYTAMEDKQRLSRSESDGAQSKTEVEIVSEVLKEKASSSTFLANIGHPESSRRPSTASVRRIQELEERLHAQEREAREAQDRQQQ